jgi:hypothetical protein
MAARPGRWVLDFAFSCGPTIGTIVLGKGSDRFGGYKQILLLASCSLLISVLLLVSLERARQPQESSVV